MAHRLLVAGSNSGYQLGLGHDEDARTFQEALCRIESDQQEGQHEITAFPPAGHTITHISSGANHTLALVEPLQIEASAPRQIWISGTRKQGQLGPEYTSIGGKPIGVFTRLDLQQCLDSIPEPSRSVSLGGPWEPKEIMCGWNCSYIVLRSRNIQEADLLISLGFHRDNTFGELGASVRSSSDDIAPCVHQISFAATLTQTGLDPHVCFRILDIAAGLRHAVATLSVGASPPRQLRTMVAGWGSARHGQVGKVPDPGARRPNSSRRPGPAAATVSEPQLVFSWDSSNAQPTRCKVRTGRDHTVVLCQRLEGTDLLSIGSTKQNQCIDASALTRAGAIPDDVADVTCNWNTTHLLMEQQGEFSSRPLILSCGSNGRGQFGNGSRVFATGEHELVPVDLDVISELSSKVVVKKLISGSEHSLLLISRQTSARVSAESEVWGWGWNEHGNLAQGPHDEADRDRPVLLLGERSGAASLPNNYKPLDIWAGCGTTFILARQGTSQAITSSSTHASR